MCRYISNFLLCNNLWALFLLLLTTAGLNTGFGPPRLTDREIAPNYRLTPGRLLELSERQDLPSVSAKALLVYDVDADQVLYKRDAEQPLRPASLTKLMTSLLVLEEAELGARVIVAQADLIDGATMGLEAGEELSVEQLLWGLLIPSGNDASLALARHTGGNVDTFVARMNSRAVELGLTATSFRNPHGFDADDHVSSAADLLILARENLRYPLFREIVATSEATVAGRRLQSTNQLLGFYPGATGVKTGTTVLAGQCLIAQIERDGHAVLIVVLGSGNRYDDAGNLFELYSRNYSWIGAERAPALLNRLYDDSGKIWYLRPQGEAAEVLLPTLQATAVRTTYMVHDRAGLIWQPGAVAGTLALQLDGHSIAEQRLILR